MIDCSCFVLNHCDEFAVYILPNKCVTLSEKDVTFVINKEFYSSF
jgi:hypothetical protein